MADLRRDKEDLRLKRSQIDEQILALLGKRAQISRDWAEGHPGDGPTLPSSEGATLDELAAKNATPLPAETIRAIFREIHAACRALEARTRVAYVGPEGGLSHVAARKQFGPGAEYVSCESAPQAIASVHDRRADFAVLPFESAQEGPVPSTLLSLRETDLKIIALNELETTLSLLCHTGKSQDVDKVYATAHDRAHAQAALSLAVPRAVVLDVKSPLIACQLAAEDHGSAALAVAAVGEPFHLAVAARAAPEGARDERVRFCVVAARPASRTGRDATALLFTVSDEPGALFEALKHFAERGVNLRKIQSRPAESDGWGYLFFIEVSGHVTDRPVVTALEGIKKQARTLKVLGSYPV